MELEDKRVMSHIQLQIIIRSINHLAKCVYGAHLFMNRLLATLRDAESNVIGIDREIRADFEWFNVDKYNRKTLINQIEPQLVFKLHVCLSTHSG